MVILMKGSGSKVIFLLLAIVCLFVRFYLFVMVKFPGSTFVMVKNY